MRLFATCVLWCVCVLSPAAAQEQILLLASESGTSYRVNVGLNDHTLEMVVDTGATYTFMPEDFLLEVGATRTSIMGAGELPDGTVIQIAGYRIARLQIGSCILMDVVVAATSGNMAAIGLNVLERLSPIQFDYKEHTFAFQCGT